MLPSSSSSKPASSASEIEDTLVRELLLSISLKKLDRSLLDLVNLKKQRGPYKWTILHQASSRSDDIEVLKIVVEKYQEKKVSLDIPDSNNFTPLDCALLEDRDPIVKLLIKAGADYRRVSPGTSESYLTHFLNKKSWLERQEFETFLNEVEQARREAQSSSFTALYNSFKTALGFNAAEASQNPETEALLKHSQKKKL